MEQRSPVLIKHCHYMSVRKLNWIFYGELQWILLFETITNIRCFNPLNTNMNTNLKYYCKQALSEKLKLIREAMNFFIKLLLGPEVFSSMIPSYILNVHSLKWKKVIIKMIDISLICNATTTDSNTRKQNYQCMNTAWILFSNRWTWTVLSHPKVWR